MSDPTVNETALNQSEIASAGVVTGASAAGAVTGDGGQRGNLSTPTTGFALANGTPNILTWTAPDDGQLHSVTAYAFIHVTSAETGGQVNLTWTTGGVAAGTTLDPGGHAAGSYDGGKSFACDPGTVVSIDQATALTAGAAKVYAALTTS